MQANPCKFPVMLYFKEVHHDTYTYLFVAGGLAAVVYTETVQTVIMLGGGIALTVFGE